MANSVYYHFSNRWVELEKRTVPQTPDYKPKGLWISDESDHGWSDFCLDDRFGLNRLTHVHEVSVRMSELIVLDTYDLVRDFYAEYRICEPWNIAIKDNNFLVRKTGFINWREIAKKAKGILISPYRYDYRHEAYWYYGWDCASGCIWDVSAIEHIKYIDPKESDCACVRNKKVSEVLCR